MKLKFLPRPMLEPTAPRAVVVAKVSRPVLELFGTTAPRAVVMALFKALLPRPVQTLKAINQTGGVLLATSKTIDARRANQKPIEQCEHPMSNHDGYLAKDCQHLARLQRQCPVSLVRIDHMPGEGVLVAKCRIRRCKVANRSNLSANMNNFCSTGRRTPCANYAGAG